MISFYTSYISRLSVICEILKETPKPFLFHCFNIKHNFNLRKICILAPLNVIIEIPVIEQHNKAMIFWNLCLHLY